MTATNLDVIEVVIRPGTFISGIAFFDFPALKISITAKAENGVIYGANLTNPIGKLVVLFRHAH